MKTAIYWFSGTGNSLAVARDLAASLDASLIPMASTSAQTRINSQAEAIGLVFPAYLAQRHGVPAIVEDFVGKLDDLAGKYVFAVCTCGGWELVNALPSLKRLARSLRRQGGRLRGQFSIHLPMNNLTYPSPLINQDQSKMFEAATSRIAGIAQRVAAGKPAAHHLAQGLFNRLMTPLYLMVQQLYVIHVRRMAHQPKGSRLGYFEAIKASDKSIKVEAACNGCGTCARICPAHNIEMTAGRPEWQHRCEMCLACDEWCPQRAVRHWCKTPGKDYRHPAVSLADMLGQGRG